MTQERKDEKKVVKESEKNRKRSDTTISSSSKDSREKTAIDCLPTKIVVRHLPPSWNAEIFLEQISPLPDTDYFYFVPADLSLGQNAYSRAYLNLINRQEITIFMEKFDGYVFVDSKGLEYPAVVEFAPFSKIPKRRVKKPDPRKGTIETDADYLKFLSQLQNSEHEAIPTPDTFLEEIETREKQLKENLVISTPLIEFLVRRREEKKLAILQAQQAREDKRRKELERRKRDEELRQQERERIREKERQKLREKEEKAKRKDDQTHSSVTSHTAVKLLKNPYRDKEEKAIVQDSTRTADSGRVKHNESGRKTTRDYESDRNHQREISSRQGTDRHSSQKQSKGEDEGDARYRSGQQSASGRSRPDRGHREKGPEDHQSKPVAIEKRPEKDPVIHDSETKEETARKRSTGDHKVDELRESKAEQQDSRLKVTQHREEKRPKQEDSKSAAGGREYRGDGRYQKERRDSKHSGETREYKDRDRKSERDDRDYRDRDKRDSRDYNRDSKEERDRDRKDDRNSEGKEDKSLKSTRKETKSGNQREPNGDKAYRSQRDEDVSTRQKSRTSDGAHVDKKSTSGSGGLRKSSVELGESEPAARSSKEKTLDTDDRESYARGGRETSDRRSSEKEHRQSGGNSSSRQRIRYKDRPERAIYNPGRRAVERKKEELPAATQAPADDVGDAREDQS